MYNNSRVSRSNLGVACACVFGTSLAVASRHAKIFAGLALLLQAGPTRAAAQQNDVKQTGVEQDVFPMQEVFAPAVEHDDRWSLAFRAGQEALCRTRPDPEVKAYPPLESDRPLFGKVTFAWDFGRQPGVTFHFAIDESGGRVPGWMRDLSGDLFGGGKRTYLYDRLYFDANRDLDLTNDPVLAALPKIPAGVLLEDDERPASRMFPPIDLDLDLDRELGTRRVRLLPLLSIARHREPEILAFLPPVARRGRIRLGRQEYDALLSQVNVITGGLDRPLARLDLTHVATSKRDDWWRGSVWLGAMRRVDGRLYRLSATPSGDRLTVEPYRGDVGVLEIRTPRAGLDAPTFSGSLLSQSQTMVPVGISSFPRASDAVARASLPVGDYLLFELWVDIGRTRARFELAPEWTRPENATGHWPDYLLKIRKEKPCMVQLSQKPTFLFPAPFVFEAADPEGKTFRPGDDLRVDAYLLDPALGIVSGLWDRSKKVDIDGGVEVIDSSGTRVRLYRDEFPWGFGCFFFRWRIPADLEIAGKREVFTLKVACDTLDLYGVVEGTTKIVVEAP